MHLQEDLSMPGASKANSQITSLKNIIDSFKPSAKDISVFFMGMTVKDLSFSNPLHNLKEYNRKYYLGLNDKSGFKITVLCDSEMFNKNVAVYGLTDKSNIEITLSSISFDKQGKLLIGASNVIADGVSTRELAKKRIIKHCQKNGYYERRRKVLPKFIARIALITTSSGNTKSDIFNQTGLAYRNMTLFTPNSDEFEIANSLRNASISGEFQLAVLFRGGNEDEHMLKFSQECVLDAVVDSPIPVASAIGHDSDQPIIQDIVDLGYSTPSSFAKAISETNNIFVREMELKKDNIQKLYIEFLKGLYRDVLDKSKNIARNFNKIAIQNTLEHTEATMSGIESCLETIILNEKINAQKTTIRNIIIFGVIAVVVIAIIATLH